MNTKSGHIPEAKEVPSLPTGMCLLRILTLKCHCDAAAEKARRPSLAEGRKLSLRKSPGGRKVWLVLTSLRQV